MMSNSNWKIEPTAVELFKEKLEKFSKLTVKIEKILTDITYKQPQKFIFFYHSALRAKEKFFFPYSIFLNCKFFFPRRLWKIYRLSCLKANIEWSVKVWKLSCSRFCKLTDHAAFVIFFLFLCRWKMNCWFSLGLR